MRDRGRGFGETEMVRAGRPGGRVALLGGTLEVLSHPGSGTLIVARVPFEGSWKDTWGG